MLRRIFALFFRSLRGDSRSIWVHASWLLLLIAIYGGLWIALLQGAMFGAPGLRFFRTVTYMNAIIVTLLGISYFSSAISEEKEEDTLGLMTMAGISPLGILLGKSTARLFQVFVLLLVQYPFTLLAVTMGGLMPDQIRAAYAALLAYTILLANVGLFCSVLCRRNRDASGLTTLWSVGYLFGPLFAYAAWHFLVYEAANDPKWTEWRKTLELPLEWYSKTSVFGQLTAVTETGYRFQWTPQLISNTIGGIVLFLLSWWLFGYVSHDPATESTTRAMVPRKTGKLRLFSAGRSWDLALAWKDFHFIAGGWFGIVIRCGLYIGLYWLAALATYPWHEESAARRINWPDVTWGYQFFVVPLFVVDCAMCMSRLFQEEIRHQTLPALMMLPRSVRYVTYSKGLGCVAGLIPGVIAMIAAFFFLTEATRTLKEIWKHPETLWIAANLILVVHLSATLSTYLRWGAFGLSLAITVGLMVFSMSMLEMLRFQFDVQKKMISILALSTLMTCGVCHVVVLLRLPYLAEK